MTYREPSSFWVWICTLISISAYLESGSFFVALIVLILSVGIYSAFADTP